MPIHVLAAKVRAVITQLPAAVSRSLPPSHVLVQALSLGPVGGPRFAVKDTIDVAGTPTRAASAALEDAAASSSHAEVVERLLAAGWQLCGKLNLHELAFGTTGLNAGTGTPLNPGWPDRVPGGSSSGSAVAVASGWVPMALGTDTGGSVRTPAACCNVIGLKPTWGRVSRRGVMPAHSTLDCVGPFARDMATLVRALQAIAPDVRELPRLPDRLRLGLVEVRADATARAAVQAAVDGRGHVLQPVTLPSFEAAYAAGLAVINRENWRALSPLLASGRVGPDIAARLRRAGETTDADVAAAEQVRARFRAEVDAALAEVDVLVLPTLASPPPRVVEAGDTSALVGMTALVRPFNISGHPALTLPLVDAHGLPVGLQLVAARGQDEWLCAVATRLADPSGPAAPTGAHA